MTVLTYPCPKPENSAAGLRAQPHTQFLWELRLDLGWERGQPDFRVAIDCVTSRTPLLLKRGDGSMYSQAYARAGPCPGSSAAVRDRGH